MPPPCPSSGLMPLPGLVPRSLPPLPPTPTPVSQPPQAQMRPCKEQQAPWEVGSLACLVARLIHVAWLRNAQPPTSYPNLLKVSLWTCVPAGREPSPQPCHMPSLPPLFLPACHPLGTCVSPASTTAWVAVGLATLGPQPPCRGSLPHQLWSQEGAYP